MNEKDIYATMARIKLKSIMQEKDNSDHGNCWCNECIAKRVKSHSGNCKCNMCIELKNAEIYISHG